MNIMYAVGNTIYFTIKAWNVGPFYFKCFTLSHSALKTEGGSNKAATNIFILACTPFLLLEPDV